MLLSGMIRFLYTCSILLYLGVIHLAFPFSFRARAWVRGRRDLWSKLKVFKNETHPIWVHCASLGEFEQARPLIEELKKLYPQHRILLTFFSPSGFEVRKQYPGADLVSYLPSDLPWNVHRFLSLTRPQMAIFVKYEFWFNYIDALSRKKIPLYLISGIFRSDQYFFKPQGFWGRKHLRMFQHLFVQDDSSLNLLKEAGVNQVSIAGDTRADRVLALTETRQADTLPAFASGGPVLVAGSTYAPDEDLLYGLALAITNVRFIIAPHEVNPARIRSLEEKFSQLGVCRRASESESPGENFRFLLIDSVGLLPYLYGKGHMAYIGGGFGKGIHNTLEPATWRLPISFGPNHGKFREAAQLIESGAATEVRNLEELLRWASRYINDESTRLSHGFAARRIVQENSGACSKILQELKSSLQQDS
jgi:3-deoxy-D-manno-octulosonic-acid transferase